MANSVIADTRTEHLSYLWKFVDSTKFRELEPHQELVNRGSCLANPGFEYVVYLSDGGRVSLDLSAPSGVMQAQWYNPRIGKYQSPTIRTDEEKHTFVAPDTLDWVLHVHNETN
jgi:hypothetical protein